MKLNPIYFSLLFVISPLVHSNEVIPQMPMIKMKSKQGNLKHAVSKTNTALKITADQKDIPQIVNIVPQEILRDQGVTSMQGALQNVAGIGFSVGDGQRDQIHIRGFNAMYDNYVDGFRDDVMYYRDLSNVDSIEVLKGPASVLYGRGSAGGLINRTTKKPTNQTIREITLMADSFGQKRSSIDLNENLSDAVKIRLTGAVENSEGYRDQSFLKRQVISPSVLWNINHNTALLLQVDYLHDNRLTDQGVPLNPKTGKPIKIDRKIFIGASNGSEVGNSDSEVKTGTLTLTHDFNDDLKYKGTLRTYKSSADRQFATTTLPTGTSSIYKLAQDRRIYGEQGWSTAHEISSNFQTGFIQHTALLGLEISNQRKNDLVFRTSNSSVNFTENNIVNPYWTPISTANPSTINNNNSTTKAIYLQDIAELSNTLKLVIGARYDHLEQYRSSLKIGTTTNTLSVLDRTDQPISPRIGLVYEPTQSLSLYASYNQSFQPISDSLVTYTNSDQFSPTKTESYETGLKWDITSNYNMTAALFQTTQNNILQDDGTGSGNAIVAGTQRTKGFELTGTGNLTSQLSILAGYSFLDGKMIKSQSADVPKGNIAPLTPKHTFNLWVKYNLNTAWYVALGGRAQSEQYAAPDNKMELPGYAIMNLAAGYHQEKYDINFNINNVFDTYYFVSAKGLSNRNAMTGDPLNAQITLRYRF